MFVIGAVLTWGAYVVTIDQGRTRLAQGLPRQFMAVAAMRAFLFIGIAYFVLAVVVPGLYLMMNKVPAAQDPGFSSWGSILSTIAGVLGAAGALCIVFAVGAARKEGVSPGAVASLVFCFAPIVNVLISMFIEPPAGRPSPAFFLGIVMAAAGAGLVLYFKPAPSHGPAQAPTTAPAHVAHSNQGSSIGSASQKPGA